MTSRRIQPWRWSVKFFQVLLVLGLPFVSVKGKSALRFDIPSLTLHFFGTSIGMDEFFLVLVAALFLGFLVILLTILLGRIWCGWLCPQTVIIDLTTFVDRSSVRGIRYRIFSFAAVLSISTLAAASLIWYFVSPYVFIERLLSGSLGSVVGGFWLVLTAITFLNFTFLRHIFCTTVCPYAKIQGAVFDDRTLIIAADRSRMDECMHCDACVRICPVNVDVREGVNAACINCAECIDACARQMGRRGRPSLIGYRFGSGSAEPGSARRGVLLSALSTVLFLGLFFHLLTVRQSVDIALISDSSLSPYRTSNGQVVNAYILSLTNRSDEIMHLTFSARREGSPLLIIPDRTSIPRHGHLRVKIVIVDATTVGDAGTRANVTVTAEAQPPHEGRVQAEAAFLAP